MTLEEARANVGRSVVYKSHHGGPGEDGVITSVNEMYVFVRYRGPGSQATLPSYLKFIELIPKEDKR